MKTIRGSLAWRVVCALILLAAVFAGGVDGAAAENLGPGGGTRIVVGDERVGPYRLFVTTSPEPAQAGNTLTVSVRVTDPASNNNLRDAQVRVVLVNRESGAVLEQAATHQDAGNPVDYAAHIPMQQAGSWRATVYVDGPAGPAEVGFEQRILVPREGGTLALMALPFLMVLGAMGFMWLRRPRSRPVMPA